MMVLRGAAMLTSHMWCRVAVGTRGTIASSYDGGFNWIDQVPEGGDQVHLSGVFVLDDGGAVAVGGNCNGK